MAALLAALPSEFQAAYLSRTPPPPALGVAAAVVMKLSQAAAQLGAEGASKALCVFEHASNLILSALDAHATSQDLPKCAGPSSRPRANVDTMEGIPDYFWKGQQKLPPCLPTARGGNKHGYYWASSKQRWLVVLKVGVRSPLCSAAVLALCIHAMSTRVIAWCRVQHTC